MKHAHFPISTNGDDFGIHVFDDEGRHLATEVSLATATAVGFEAASVLFLFFSKWTMSFVGDCHGSVGVLAMAAAMAMAEAVDGGGS